MSYVEVETTWEAVEWTGSEASLPEIRLIFPEARTFRIAGRGLVLALDRRRWIASACWILLSNRGELRCEAPLRFERLYREMAGV